MTRAYSLTIEARGLTPEQIRAVAVKKYGWRETDARREGIYSELGLEGNLSNGKMEHEAHDQIYAALKCLNPAAKIQTRWTCLDNLPYEEYGDEDVRGDS